MDNHENICKKYDFMYDRNKYMIKYVYVDVLTIPYILQKILSKKSARPTRPQSRDLLIGRTNKYFARSAHINTDAVFL